MVTVLHRLLDGDLQAGLDHFAGVAGEAFEEPLPQSPGKWALWGWFLRTFLFVFDNFIERVVEDTIDIHVACKSRVVMGL